MIPSALTMRVTAPLAGINPALVPSEIVRSVVGVLARLIFDSLKSHRRTREDGLSVPIVSVLEAAHTVVPSEGGKTQDRGLKCKL
jgi:hypothetical protein